MALYRVVIPYHEAASGSQVRYTTLEVEADSEPMARRLARVEFDEISVFGPAGGGPEIIERDIRVERAPVARRSAFDVTLTALGPNVASADSM